MYGLFGSCETPRPWSMIERSCFVDIARPTTRRAGTAGETPPTPFGPWHWEHANWTKSWAPSATRGATVARCAVDVPESAYALPHVAPAAATATRTRRRR